MESKKEDEGGISIHQDLVIEILSRLPVKTLARLKCLSKEFSRIIQTRNFVDSCLSCSSNRSRLLFYFDCRDDNALVFFSAPHRSRACSIAPTRYEMTVRGGVGVSVSVESPIGLGVSVRSPPVRGLIFYTIGPNQHVICNPATRQHFSLPENEILGKSEDEFLIFGYDPISNQFKVLCISGSPNQYQYQYQFWILRVTVGQDGNLWRKIRGMPSHLHPSLGRQAWGQSDGILYFQAYCHTPGHGYRGKTTHVVSFDLNSEKFSLVKANSHLSWFSKLIDFQGKLGFISRVKDCQVEFSCLMQDKEWSSTVFHLPWAQGQKYWIISSSVLGICDGEIVFAPFSKFGGYTWHLSLERKTTRKVDFEIPSNESYGRSLAYFFANHADTHVSL